MPKVNEPGKYFGKIVSATLMVKHKKPCYVVGFELDGVRDGEIDGVRTITGYFYLSKNDGGRNDGSIEAVKDVTGWSGLSLRELGEIDVTDVRVWVPVDENNYQGTMGYQVKTMRKSGGAPKKAAEGDEWDAIADAWESGEAYVAAEVANEKEEDVPF